MLPSLPTSKNILATSKYILSQVLTNNATIISSWEKFKAFLIGSNFTDAVDELNSTAISSLKSGMKSRSTCGTDLMYLLDRTWMTVQHYRQESLDITEADLRLRISNSDLVLYDTATVTNSCMKQMVAESSDATAYKTRETLRKTLGVVINDFISKGISNNGTTLNAEYYAYQAIQKGLPIIFVSGFDPMDISTLLVAKHSKAARVPGPGSATVL
ncbi:uncharacterized protein IUM83_09512 [Phytophthora cinnamomi]|uniref:uncharacterized protein n=1 Tax=Phytophthora cinnamomi TaxID=4785 RepID=UPI00355A5669|nr:hypothetical protein IUM83_09512 [Phytophthora cinnamomi]